MDKESRVQGKQGGKKKEDKETRGTIRRKQETQGARVVTSITPR